MITEHASFIISLQSSPCYREICVVSLVNFLSLLYRLQLVHTVVACVIAFSIVRAKDKINWSSSLRVIRLGHILPNRSCNSCCLLLCCAYYYSGAGQQHLR